MEKSFCTSCRSAKAPLTCASCTESLCKTCAQFVDAHTFSFLPAVPGELASGSYCIQCYESKARPEVEKYEAQMAQARNISIYMKNQSKEVRALRRAQFPVKVAGCEDREETLMRLAFLTVAEGYDTLINVEISPKKVRNGSYQHLIFEGIGTPAERRQRRGGKPESEQ